MFKIEEILTAVLIVYIAVINIVAFVFMYSDKKRAKNRKRRIPEKTLFLTVILGGGIGGTIGMHRFHHKTKHWYFSLGFPMITLIEIAAATVLIIYMI